MKNNVLGAKIHCGTVLAIRMFTLPRPRSFTSFAFLPCLQLVEIGLILYPHGETVCFLYAFFGWRCDIRRGKNGRHCPGIAYKSSLESFWKWWHLVLKQETVSGLSKDITIKVNDVGI